MEIVMINVGKELVRLLTFHRRGLITILERDGSIRELATEPGFFDHIDNLPPDVVEALRRGARAGSHPEDYLDGGGVHYDHFLTEEEFVAIQRQGREKAYWRDRLLQEHFFPSLPLPIFEPMKSAGFVTDAMPLGDSVVVFGVDDTFIRNHPVQLAPPDGGERIVTSVLGVEYILNAEDERKDLDPLQYQLHRFEKGRRGLVLDASVRTPSQVPSGTEVWVDRSAVREIPPLAEVLSSDALHDREGLTMSRGEPDEA